MLGRFTHVWSCAISYPVSRSPYPVPRIPLPVSGIKFPTTRTLRPARLTFNPKKYYIIHRLWLLIEISKR